jgi:hypothetical protein
VVCTNGVGAAPGIAATMLVPNAPGGVELALDTDLVAGGIYAVTSANVPGADATLSPSATECFTFGDLVAPTVNVEQPQDDLGALLYAIDLVWTGSDFLETSARDLATVSGLPNLQGAEQRRLVDVDGLPWDATYGAKAGDFVNAPVGTGQQLLGRLRRQAVADDRIAKATVTLLEDDDHPGDTYFPVTLTPRGAKPDGNFTINVPMPSG